MSDTLNTVTSQIAMTKERTFLVHDSNISYAWGRLLLRLNASAHSRCGPLAICLSGFPRELPDEDCTIRKALDILLGAYRRYPSSVSAMIVFPYREWIRQGKPSCREFSEWCRRRFVPRLHACNPLNRRGLYFERMMDFKGSAGDDRVGKNQLLHIIDWWHERQRKQQARPPHSRMQATCFDPLRDHNHECRPWFPCLQQVSFVYEGQEDLTVCAYYPTQYVFDRAYGNLSGLCGLGTFMADQLHLRFTGLTCFVGRAYLGNIPKRGIAKLVKLVEDRLPQR